MLFTDTTGSDASLLLFLVLFQRKTLLLHRFYWSNGYYREPGNAGYSVDNPLMEQHLNSCIDNDTGAPAPCLLPPGSSYIACQDGLGDETGVCEVMKPCLNQHQQEEQEQDMSGKSCADDTNTSTTCPIIMDSVKWCRQYTIEVATPAAEDPTNNRPNNNSNNNGTAAPASSTSGRGFVPLTNMCITPKGQFSQAPKQVIDPLSSSRDVATTKTCTYASGEAVQRSLSGPYAACGLSRSGNKNSTTSMENAVCDTVFQGGYESWEYDPRYRPWYTVTKELQKSHWTKPFTFFALAIGMTYATPIYSIDDATGRQVFAGVLAVDYRCTFPFLWGVVVCAFVQLCSRLCLCSWNENLSIIAFCLSILHFLLGSIWM